MHESLYDLRTPAGRNQDKSEACSRVTTRVVD